MQKHHPLRYCILYLSEPIILERGLERLTGIFGYNGKSVKLQCTNMEEIYKTKVIRNYISLPSSKINPKFSFYRAYFCRFFFFNPVVKFIEFVHWE